MVREIVIPEPELEFSFARSSGPGGQNVNKVNTKAVLHWKLGQTAALSMDEILRLEMRLARHLNKQGEVVVSSDRFRNQGRNREDCIEKLYSLIREGLKEKKKRKKTKPTRASVRKAQEKKAKNSEKKKLRQRVTAF